MMRLSAGSDTLGTKGMLMSTSSSRQTTLANTGPKAARGISWESQGPRATYIGVEVVEDAAKS